MSEVMQHINSCAQTNESILACEFCSGREYQLDKMRHINQLRTQFRERIDVTK